MIGLVFVDTNVFLYALDDADLDKQKAALLWRHSLWSTRRGRISFQVLQGLYAKITQIQPTARDRARAEVRDSAYLATRYAGCRTSRNRLAHSGPISAVLLGFLDRSGR